MRIKWNSIGSWIKQQSPYVHSASNKLDGLSKIIISSSKVVLLILILYYLVKRRRRTPLQAAGYSLKNNVALWSFEKENGVVIEPFAAKGTGQNIDGMIQANLLQYDLQKIREIGRANQRANITFQVKPNDSGE